MSIEACSDIAALEILQSTSQRSEEQGLIAGLQSTVEYAFQPIVNMHTGGLYGVEALIRGHEALGFTSVPELIEQAYRPSTARAADAILCEKALKKFAQLRTKVNSTLFLNMESRFVLSDQFDASAITASVAQSGIDPQELCMEVSEATSVAGIGQAKHQLLKISSACLLALDDFGVGHSGLQMLYDTQPNFIKIDRFFVSGINADQRRKVFLASIVNLAHVLGIRVIAKGVETEIEFRVCREIGCDLAQGYWIDRPSLDLSLITQTNERVIDSNRNDRRIRNDPREILMCELDPVPPIAKNETVQNVFAAFRANSSRSLFPVVDDGGRPIGIIHETKLKEVVYSPFGKELLERRARKNGIAELITPCLTCDMNANIDNILSATLLHHDDACVLIVDGDAYVGVLHHSNLLRLIGERNLARARRENPLTQLPGNIAISEYIANALDDSACQKAFAYFDFNNFKPFNDKFGFRLGDRAIVQFAEILRQHFSQRRAFLGHVGGDDFFAGWTVQSGEDVVTIAREIVDEFNASALIFYPAEIRAEGVMEGFDRSGNYQKFPLLSVSCALLEIEAAQASVSIDQVSSHLADLKKTAKNSETLISYELISSEIK